MKIFSPPKTNAPVVSDVVKKGPKSKKHAAPAVKQEISEKEIRDKLASHVETSNTAKSKMVQKNSKALGAGFLSEANVPAVRPLPETVAAEKESSLQKSHLLLSDVQLNDPTDSNTQEKLKTVLRSGSFSFNSKEKETLEKILAGN